MVELRDIPHFGLAFVRDTILGIMRAYRTSIR
jgi:hypothetical protein